MVEGGGENQINCIAQVKIFDFWVLWARSNLTMNFLTLTWPLPDPRLTWTWAWAWQLWKSAPLPWLRSISCDAHFVYFSLLQPLDTGQAPDNLPSPVRRGITVLARPEHQTKTGHYLQQVFSSKCSFQCISRDNWGIFLLLSFDLWFMLWFVTLRLQFARCHIYLPKFHKEGILRETRFYVPTTQNHALLYLQIVALKMSFVFFIEDVRCFSSTHHQ